MIYVLCAAIIIAAVPLAWWLKRDAERSWERHQALVAAERRREQFASLNKAVIDFRITVVDAFTPALKKAMRAMQELTDALNGEPS